jgi:hypothetical protein
VVHMDNRGSAHGTLKVSLRDAVISENGTVTITLDLSGSIQDGAKTANILHTQTFTLSEKARLDITPGRIDIRRDPRQSNPL